MEIETAIGTQNEEQAKTYTQEEVDRLIQAESDKRVSQALKTQERKNAEKVKEAEKLAKMNEAEKYEYELQQREKAIADKEKALMLAENRNEASKILAEKGLSLSLVDFIVADDAETMSKNIGILDKAFKACVKAEVEKRLGTQTPQKSDDVITKDTFRKMSMAEQSRLYASDPELYSQLIK